MTSPAESESIQATAEQTEPSLDLYQRQFPLSEPDFMRLRMSSPVLTTIGAAVLSFGLSYGLPFVVKALRTQRSTRIWPEDDLWIAGVLVGAGLIFILLGQVLSRERRRVIRNIKRHFARNPGRLQSGRGGSND